ncbi:hypothetical protein UFOVP844_60 [uncultured Caudovirales phage]|uniref:Uncharacterized protein n=1 Tax=uncultured Caudovirales phage TaxID=2100421 RepID=A0A6J5PC67_9CAUD|nr:hypothetical protein UFOVP844_60 [uncultured Caudovirales phage]
MKTVIGYDHLHTIPSNDSALKVVYATGTHYNPKVKSNAHGYSTAQPPLRPPEKWPRKVTIDPLFEDLTGFKVGYFTCIGMLMCNDFNKWVVRCSCGNYEIRKTKTLKRIEDKVDQNRCQSCLDLEQLRHKDYWQIHGRYPWQKPKKKNNKEVKNE